ncbi:tetratricopeptide repeat protein [Alistipes communis]|uniref:tetratricopeptide repeat protein n=1 Tax=Alistipes communis TaxID=2585118 RepID=UPI003AF1B0E5
MPASYDEQLKESMMNLQIEQVTVSVSNFRNVAERNGKIDLEFSITVPRTLLDERWRVDLRPMLCTARDTFALKRLVLTGERFRRRQQQDMERYRHYLGSIVDSADFFRYFGDISGFERYLAEAERKRQRLLHDRSVLEELTAEQAVVDRQLHTYDRKSYRRAQKKMKRYAERAERRRPKREMERYDGRSVDRLNAFLAAEYRPAEEPWMISAIREGISDSAKSERYRIKELDMEANIRTLGRIDTAALMRKYCDLRKIEQNERRRRDKEKVFRDMVRFPELPNTRLDTIVDPKSDRMTYLYADQLDATEHTNKLYLYLQATVTSANGQEYRLPSSDTLTYSVTSMTQFVDPTPRYVQRIVLRDAEVNARFFFVFKQGRSVLHEELADNRVQLEAVKRLTQKMMSDPVFAIDSITLTATSSPEGTWRTNERLARERSEALKAVLSHEFRKMKDSLEIAGSYIADADGSIRRLEQKNPLPDLHVLLKTKWKAEDWDRLRALVVADTCMVDKEEVLALFTAERDPDRREAQIRRRFPRAYAYMRQALYPQLRAVNFQFSLRRRGMQQDTVWTTELDSAYMEGVDLLRKRHYEDALKLLRPYEDRNTALAYMSIGYDRAALRILRKEIERKPADAEMRYLLAVVAARLHDEETAVTSLLRAAEIEPRLRFRANLDPELSALVRSYKLFND